MGACAHFDICVRWCTDQKPHLPFRRESCSKGIVLLADAMNDLELHIVGLKKKYEIVLFGKREIPVLSNIHFRLPV